MKLSFTKVTSSIRADSTWSYTEKVVWVFSKTETGGMGGGESGIQNSAQRRGIGAAFENPARKIPGRYLKSLHLRFLPHSQIFSLELNFVHAKGFRDNCYVLSQLISKSNHELPARLCVPPLKRARLLLGGFFVKFQIRDFYENWSTYSDRGLNRIKITSACFRKVLNIF